MSNQNNITTFALLDSGAINKSFYNIAKAISDKPLLKFETLHESALLRGFFLSTTQLTKLAKHHCLVLVNIFVKQNSKEQMFFGKLFLFSLKVSLVLVSYSLFSFETL